MQIGTYVSYADLEKNAFVLRALGRLAQRAASGTGRAAQLVGQAVVSPRAIGKSGPEGVVTGLAGLGVLGAGGYQAAKGLESGYEKMQAPVRQIQEMRQAAHHTDPLGTFAEVTRGGPILFPMKTSTASAEVPMSRVSDDIYVAHALGVLGDEEVAHIEGFSYSLNKTAAFSPEVKNAITTGVVGAAATAAGSLAMMGVAKGVSNVYDAMTFDKDLQKILKVRPELNTYPKEQVKLVYQSLRRLSPEISKDPLTASTYLVRQFERRNPSDPHSLPTVELETARTLAQTSSEYGKRRDAVREALLQANQIGVTTGLAQYQSSQQNAFVRGENEKKRQDALEREQREIKREQEGRLRAAKDRFSERAHEQRMAELRNENASTVHMHRAGELEQKLNEARMREAGLAARVDSLTEQIARNTPATRQQRIADQARMIREARDAGQPNPFGNRRRR